jgi:HK97 family phage major capsid protein/HK97 family phage prohead protease
MKLKPQTRLLQMMQSPVVDMTARTVTFPFSSEMPVERWYGMETLSHEPNAADLARLNSGANLLFNHDMNMVLGAVERAWINPQDRRGYATVRFAKTPMADEKLGMVQDNILRNVSFMYRIIDAKENPKTNAITVTRFEPLEISIVTVPADQSVGIGRAYANEETEVRVERIEDEAAGQPASPAQAARGVTMEDVKPAAATVADPQAQNPIAYEQARKQAIINLVRANKLDERIGNAWITQGASMEQVSKDILQILEERSKNAPEMSAAHIGMEKSDVRRYSLMKAIRAVNDKNWKEATLELEASNEVMKRTGRTGSTENSFFVPLDIQVRNVQKRDAYVGADASGGFLRATDNIGFIELLRNRSVVFNMGARRLSGLVGNVTIPKQTVGATAYWLASETATITEGNLTFAQLALTPRTVGAYVEISRLLQLQSSPDAEAIIMSDLAQQVALAVDLAALAGTGTEQPTGIIGTASVGAFTGTSLDLAALLNAQSDVASANALQGSLGYVFTPTTAALLMARQRFTNTDTPLWQGNMLDGTILGFRAMSSNQMPSAKGIFGDWSQVVIGEWGVLELAVNPFAGFTAGITGLRAMYTVDVGVRYAGAFSCTASIT